MDPLLLGYIRSLGVLDPVCSTCMSERFTSFKVLGTQIICCSQCDQWLDGEIRENYLKSSEFTPTLKMSTTDYTPELLSLDSGV